MAREVPAGSEVHGDWNGRARAGPDSADDCGCATTVAVPSTTRAVRPGWSSEHTESRLPAVHEAICEFVQEWPECELPAEHEAVAGAFGSVVQSENGKNVVCEQDEPIRGKRLGQGFMIFPVYRQVVDLPDGKTKTQMRR